MYCALHRIALGLIPGYVFVLAASCPAAEIPVPYEPVRVETMAPGSVGQAVSVWGRTYRFERGPLPWEILSQGVPLLASAPEIKVSTLQGPISLDWTEAAIEKARPEQVVLGSQASGRDLRITSRTTIEYDGMILVDLEIAAEPDTLNGFFYEFSVPNSVARYYTHHLPYDPKTRKREKDKLLQVAGLIPPQLSITFVPTFSIGNRTVGIEWWSESNANWSSGGTPLQLRREAEITTLRIEPIASRVSNGSRWAHRFALFPAPMREAPDWRSTRFTFSSHARRLNRRIGTRYVLIAFVPHFDSVWHGLPMSRKSARQRKIRKDLRRDDVAYLPYAKLAVAPSLHPMTLDHIDSWPATGRLYKYGPAAELEMNRARGWKEGTPYTYAVCLGRADYIQWILEEGLKTFREEETDGLYYDLAAIAEPCQRSPRIHDKMSQQEWNYFAVRDFFKRLYTEMKRERPESILAIHTPGQPKALAAWADYTFVGEALNLEFRDGRKWKPVRDDPLLYVPDYIGLPRGFLEALIWPFFGGATSLLPQVHHAADPRDPTRTRRYTREFFSVALVEDMPTWLANTDNETRLGLLQAIDRFGGFRNVSVEPYWSNQDRIKRDPKLRITAYLRDGRALLIVSNWEDEEVRSRIELNQELLSLEGARRVRDGERWSRRGLPFKDGAFDVVVPPRDLRILIVD